MIYWAAVFLVIALVAAFLGFSGIAGVSMKSRGFYLSSAW